MAAKRPWWHEIVAGLSTERTPAAVPHAAPSVPVEPGILPGPEYSVDVSWSSRAPRSPEGVIRRRVSSWDPGSPAMEWVRRVTYDGRAIAIRRAQDAHRRRAPQSLGITPFVAMRSAPRAQHGPPALPCLEAPFDRVPAYAAEVPSYAHLLAAPLAPPSAAAGDARPPPACSRTLVHHHLPFPPSCVLAAPTPPPSGAPAPSAAPPRPRSPERLVEVEPHAIYGAPPPRSPVTNCGAPAPPPTLAALPSGTGIQGPSKRRPELSTAPAVLCSLPRSDPAPAAPRLRGKGAKHARLCAGPWASALHNIPPLPLTGARRANAGLSDVPLTSADITSVRRERAACALVSILPWSAAGFVLGDSDAMVASRPPHETAAKLVRVLSAYGVSSTEAAHSALGRLVSWVVVHHPGATVIEGSYVSDFLEHNKPSTTTLAALAWLRDHCGLAIPARGPVCRAFRSRPPNASRSKESLTVGAIVSLEYLATHHPSEYVRGHAAGWSVLARLALRVEQAQSCVISAFVPHEFEGMSFTIVVGAVHRDKHPDPAKRRPRPIWGIIDGLDDPGCLRSALGAMLLGVEQGQFLLRDTDSPDGDPSRATSWVSAPLRSATRVDTSLQALLRLPPASLSVEEAGRHHGHSAKRFLLNVAEASGAFTPVEANEVGRFSRSTAQSPDLEPVAAMLQAHSMRASVLPDIYAGKAKVARVFDLLAKSHTVLQAARAALSANPALPSTGDASWGSSGPFAAERTATQPLLLTHVV